MLQKTHSLAGLLAAEVAVLYTQTPLVSWESAAALTIGCLVGPLADMDKKGSTMAKLLLPVSFLLHSLHVKHRTLTHSLLFLLLFAVTLKSLPDLYYWTFLFAYASHPLIDLFNAQGVALLWPLNMRIRLLPKSLAVDTGSSTETIFRWAIVLFAVAIPVVLLLPEGVL